MGPRPSTSSSRRRAPRAGAHEDPPGEAAHHARRPPTARTGLPAAGEGLVLLLDDRGLGTMPNGADGQRLFNEERMPRIDFISGSCSCSVDS